MFCKRNLQTHQTDVHSLRSHCFETCRDTQLQGQTVYEKHCYEIHIFENVEKEIPVIAIVTNLKKHAIKFNCYT